MAMSVTNQIKFCIESIISSGGQDNIIVCPYGDIGMETVQIMEKAYDIKPKLILDNHLCKYNNNIKPVNYLYRGGGIYCPDYSVLIATANPDLYLELKNEIGKYFKDEQIISLPSIIVDSRLHWKNKTIIGKHSYGSIVKNHPHIESIGNYCSIAFGADVVPEHPTELLSTHPFLFSWSLSLDAGVLKNESWYVEGIKKSGYDFKHKKSKIGNDVWIGRNAIIIGGVNIGNGAVIGAGAIVTHDIPDYAVAVGVPARVIKYRYTKEQIKALNAIKWWDWTDEQIAERYDDLFLDIDEFIKKYL